MVRIVLTPRQTKLASIATRGVQFVSSLVALITINSGFINSTFAHYTFRLGSHDANSAMLATYTSMMYSAWFAGFVDIYPMVSRPRRKIIRLIDVALAIFLVASGFALVFSDYIQKCDGYNTDIRCKTLTTGAVATFVSVLPLIVSIALTFAGETAPAATSTKFEEASYGYVLQTTPTTVSLEPPMASERV